MLLVVANDFATVDAVDGAMESHIDGVSKESYRTIAKANIGQRGIILTLSLCMCNRCVCALVGLMGVFRKSVPASLSFGNPTR